MIGFGGAKIIKFYGKKSKQNIELLRSEAESTRAT